MLKNAFFDALPIASCDDLKPGFNPIDTRLYNSITLCMHENGSIYAYKPTKNGFYSCGHCFQALTGGGFICWDFTRKNDLKTAIDYLIY